MYFELHLLAIYTCNFPHRIPPTTPKIERFVNSARKRNVIAKISSFKKNIPPLWKTPGEYKKQPAKTFRNLNSRLKKIQRKIQKIQSFQHLVEKSFLSFPLSKNDFYINTQKFHKITDFRLKTGRNFRRSQAPCGKREKFSTGNSSVFLKIPWITG